MPGAVHTAQTPLPHPLGLLGGAQEFFEALSMSQARNTKFTISEVEPEAQFTDGTQSDVIHFQCL